jgi:DNA polymerase I
MEVFGDPNLPREISCVQVLNGRKQRFEGPEKVVLADLLEFIKVHDPDVILLPYADTWVPLIVKKAKRYGLEPTFSRSNWFKSMTSKSYWSYGKVNHKDGAMIPESIISVGLFLIFELTGMRDFSINNGRSRLVEGVGPHSQ